MKHTRFAALGLVLIAVSGQINAVLPPLYSTAAEIAAIVQDKDIGNVLPDGEPIVDVRKNDKGYLVTTSKHEVQANIVYQRAAHPGPSQFTVNFQPAGKLDSVGVP